MASVGTMFKIKIDRILSNRNIRSTATFTSKTKTIGAYGGYEGATETSGTATTVNCIPASFSGTDFIINMAGNFNAGDVKLIVKADTTVNKDYAVTWQSATYDIEEIRPVVINDVVVAKILNLSKNTA